MFYWFYFNILNREITIIYAANHFHRYNYFLFSTHSHLISFIVACWWVMFPDSIPNCSHLLHDLSFHGRYFAEWSSCKKEMFLVNSRFAFRKVATQQTNTCQRLTIATLKKVWNTFKVYNKDTRRDKVLTLLSTLNTFHIFWLCFYCWLSTCKPFLVRFQL